MPLPTKPSKHRQLYEPCEIENSFTRRERTRESNFTYWIVNANRIFIANVRIQSALVFVRAKRIIFVFDRVAVFAFARIRAHIVHAFAVAAFVRVIGVAFVYICEIQSCRSRDKRLESLRNERTDAGCIFNAVRQTGTAKTRIAADNVDAFASVTNSRVFYAFVQVGAISTVGR